LLVNGFVIAPRMLTFVAEATEALWKTFNKKSLTSKERRFIVSFSSNYFSDCWLNYHSLQHQFLINYVSRLNVSYLFQFIFPISDAEMFYKMLKANHLSAMFGHVTWPHFPPLTKPFLWSIRWRDTNIRSLIRELKARSRSTLKWHQMLLHYLHTAHKIIRLLWDIECECNLSFKKHLCDQPSEIHRLPNHLFKKNFDG